MAEWRVAEVVPERHRLRKVFVEVERARDGPSYLRRLQCVREPRDHVIARWRDEDLGLVLQPAEGFAVEDAVAVALERRPQRRRLFGALPAAALEAPGGKRREKPFAILEATANRFDRVLMNTGRWLLGHAVGIVARRQPRRKEDGFSSVKLFNLRPNG